MTTFVLQCAQSPVGIAPADMSVAYVNQSQCIWAEQAVFPPPMSMAQGAAVASAVIAVWAAAFVIRTAINLFKGNHSE
jgi:hypothetical protein